MYSYYCKYPASDALMLGTGCITHAFVKVMDPSHPEWAVRTDKIKRYQDTYPGVVFIAVRNLWKQGESRADFYKNPAIFQESLKQPTGLNCLTAVDIEPDSPFLRQNMFKPIWVDVMQSAKAWPKFHFVLPGRPHPEPYITPAQSTMMDVFTNLAWRQVLETTYAPGNTVDWVNKSDVIGIRVGGKNGYTVAQAMSRFTWAGHDLMIYPDGTEGEIMTQAIEFARIAKG